MKRRELLALVGCAVAAQALSLPARAQQRGALPVIGYLGTTTPEAMGFRIPAFRQGLTEAGFTEGKNVAIEFRWAAGRYDRLPE